MGGTPSKKLHRAVELELLSQTEYDAHELRKWYARFLEEYPEGLITKERFVEENLKFTNFGDAGFWKHIFDVLDTDKNGDVSFGEWICALSTLTKGATMTKLEWLFHVFDLDNDGFIEHDELLLILQWLYKVNPPVGLTIEELTDQVFDALDSDHDEKITLAEFALGFKRVPLLQKNLSFLNQLVTSSLPHVQTHGLSPPEVRSPRAVSSPPDLAASTLRVPAAGAPTLPTAVTSSSSATAISSSSAAAISSSSAAASAVGGPGGTPAVVSPRPSGLLPV
eukprot:CAMPEP_0174238146 /NCGR_PEP_ID=MMETSP0417-20130205/10261_1 /TAXON_ID=242541 /ORGANISM="Mayorella sp, Strain BSH-02190019" /LENGTH=279 /DNA_ID=CAMNT_0015316951 /DNA_START=55 /DNA_END=891 /DNA_ORIENTATION=-